MRPNDETWVTVIDGRFFCLSPLSWHRLGFELAYDTSTLGVCSSCHNGLAARGKNTTHINSTNACNLCHNSVAWKPATRVDHTQVIGTCASCHNGTIAIGKTLTHIKSTVNCQACHSLSAWKPATKVDHNEVIGACGDCHNGTIATGKPAGHSPTMMKDCGACHTTANWIVL